MGTLTGRFPRRVRTPTTTSTRTRRARRTSVAVMAVILRLPISRHQWQDGHHAAKSCQCVERGPVVIRDVAVPVLDNVFAFELGVLCEVFGVDRPDEPEL